MENGRAIWHGNKHPDRQSFGKGKTYIEVGHQKLGQSQNESVNTPKKKKIVSAGSDENTGENITSDKNDTPRQPSSPNSQEPPLGEGYKNNKIDFVNPISMSKKQEDNRVTFQYNFGQTAYQIKVSNSTSKDWKFIDNERSLGRKELGKIQQNQENDINKSTSPNYRQQQGFKKRKIEFSNVEVHFPQNQLSQSNLGQNTREQFRFLNLNRSPIKQQKEIQSSLNFQLPSSLRQSRSKLIGSISKSNQGSNMFALQRILQVSSLYQNYLKKTQYSNKPSQNYLEVGRQKKIQKLPTQLYYKPERIVFHRPNNDLDDGYCYNGYHIVCKVTEDRTRLYYQDLKLQQLYNMDGMKSSEIIFDKQLNISKNVEYDHFNKRFYLFSNQLQKILVYSETNQEKLCEIKVQKKVKDPHLFIHHVNNRSFLLIVGGYCKIQKNIVQGSKFIQIFQLMRWEIQLKSKIINLITGRISPIVLKIMEKEENKILILGGNTIAKINKNGKLDFDYQKDMNESTNLTGLSITSHQILQLFDIKEQAIYCNRSVRCLNPLSLHDGCVVSIKGAFMLMLPDSKDLFQVKVFNKEVNIIQSNKCNYLRQKQEFQQRQYGIRVLHQLIVFYTINQQGLLQILTSKSQVQRKCPCIIY